MAERGILLLTSLLLACACAVTLSVPVEEIEGQGRPQVPGINPVIDLLPPKFKPGDVITKTDHQSVDNALTEVLRAGGILQGRRCAIGVANLGETSLSAPAWYVDSGVIYSSAPYTIPPRQTGLTLFHKRDVYIFGTTGLLTYDIEGTDYKVAMLWQVPWNTVLYNVLLNVKLYHKNVPTNKAMFKQMLNYAGAQKSEGWMDKTEYGIKVLASITDNVYAKYYVSVDASNYSAEAGPQHHTECDTNPIWLGKYCWQECTPTGYCWVNRKCNSAADCQGPLTCHDKCKNT